MNDWAASARTTASTTLRRWAPRSALQRYEVMRPLMADVRSRHPRFIEAVRADLKITAAYRNEPHDLGSRSDSIMRAVHLAIVSDSFLAQVCYRAKARCQSLGIPVLPALLHRLAISTGQICIGDPVVVHAGVYIPHGQTVIDGFTEIGAGVVISPFTSVGLVSGKLQGPTIGRRTMIGTGARVLGPLVVGEAAHIGANAVVLSDVPAGATAVGVPARILPARPDTPTD